MSFTWKVRKPLMEICTLYVPASTAGKTKMPTSFVVDVTTARVAWFVKVTSAPGMTRPPGSFTVPVSTPETFCAKPADSRSAKQIRLAGMSPALPMA